MKKIPFQDGVKITSAYVTIDGQNYEVHPAVYEGDTPFSSSNINKLQDNVEEAINVQQATVTLESTINANTNYTIPLSYKVGNNSLEVFYCGSKLEKRCRLQRDRRYRRSIYNNTIYGQRRRLRYERRGRL